MSTNLPPTKVLFLAWGQSIHAERRIRLFCEDARFETTVVSTFDYGFENARNINLTAARSASAGGTAYTKTVQKKSSGRSSRVAQRLKGLYRRSTELPLVGAPWHEAVTSARDYRILYQAVDRFQPDVIFCQTLLYPCYLSLALPQRIPRMVTFWNGDVLAWAAHRGVERLFKRRIVKLGVESATAVTSNSQRALDVCLEEYGASPEKLHLIRYPGIEIDKYHTSEKEEAKARLGISGNRLVLNGRGPVPHQNLDVLVRAAPAILAEFPETVFLFLSPAKGVGPEAYAELRQLAVRLGVDKAMIWRGNVPHAELPEILSATDVAVSLSTEDSLPNSMLDAMACRVPVVIADLPQIREWVTDGENGLIVGSRDENAVAKAVNRLLSDPELARKFTEKSYELVRTRASYASQVPLIKDLVIEIAASARKS